MDYSAWVASKNRHVARSGFHATVNDGHLFPFQRALVQTALESGRFALFTRTGSGKTRMELTYAAYIVERLRTIGATPRVLLLAPLAVGPQTAREAERCGIPDVRFVRDPEDVRDGVTIVNYESLHRFDAAGFEGAILDESGILKHFDGKTRTKLIDTFHNHPFRLPATATPAPNDFDELGNHSEFLGDTPRGVMLAKFFKNDSADTGTWVLKGHAVRPFWDWVAGWSRTLQFPSDLGDYSDDGYILPPMHIHKHVVAVDIVGTDGELFRQIGTSATTIHKEKRYTAPGRADKVAELVTGQKDRQWLVWCDTNYEADEVTKRIPEAVEVRGDMDVDTKIDRLMGFADGNIRVLVTKTKIAGYGMNFQNCRDQVWAGVSHSWEQFHQGISRSHRFGQTGEVNIHVVMGATETGVWQNIIRKQDGHETMQREMIAASRRAANRQESMQSYNPQHIARLPAWLNQE